MKLILRVLLFAAVIYTAYALCNTCSALTSLACVANDKFEVCVDGLPVAPAMPCPSGTVCTAGMHICSSALTAAPSCARCGVCNANKTFACTGYNTLALCWGTTTPDTLNILCPGTTVCNIDAPFGCVDPTIAGIGGSCPSVTTTVSPTVTPSTTPGASTTPDPGADPQAFCELVQSAGRYEIKSDATCKTYVTCTLAYTIWYGTRYECPGSTRFNGTSKMCGVGVPARCV